MLKVIYVSLLYPFKNNMTFKIIIEFMIIRSLLNFDQKIIFKTYNFLRNTRVTHEGLLKFLFE
jgi:hypothetical protein